MKAIKMLRYILGSLLLIFVISNNSAAQEKKEMKNKDLYPQEMGIALGVDLAPFILQWADPARQGMNFLARVSVTPNLFAVGEVGYEKYDYTSVNYNYNSKGMGLKLGIDYDVFNPAEKGNNDNIFFGARYGFSWQDHGSSGYTVVNGYWDDTTGSVDNYFFNTHYGEILFGLRTEVFKHLFMGVTMRGKAIFYNSNSKTLEPSSIPGYGTPSPFNFGFSYTLEYQIPYFWK